MNNIAGQTAKPERQARPEEKQSPHNNADSAKNQKGPSEFAEWVHKFSLKLASPEVKGKRHPTTVWTKCECVAMMAFVDTSGSVHEGIDGHFRGVHC